MARCPSGIGFTSVMTGSPVSRSTIGLPSASSSGSSVSSIPVAQRRGRPMYSLVTIMSASALLRASTSGHRSAISDRPAPSRIRSWLRMRTTGTTPSGLAMVSIRLNPVAAPLLLARSRSMRSGRYQTSSVVRSVSQRLTAAVICRVPGSVVTATCRADSTVTAGAP